MKPTTLIGEMVVFDDLPQDLLPRSSCTDDEDPFALGGWDEEGLSVPVIPHVKGPYRHAKTAGEQERETSVHEEDGPGIPSLKSIKNEDKSHDQKRRGC